jgi:hypothetical protein
MTVIRNTLQTGGLLLSLTVDMHQLALLKNEERPKYASTFHQLNIIGGWLPSLNSIKAKGTYDAHCTSCTGSNKSSGNPDSEHDKEFPCQ